MYHYGPKHYHSSDLVSQRASEVYANECPVVLHHRDTDREDHLLVTDITASAPVVAVASNVASGQAFQVYAKSANLESWIIADGDNELILLEDAWPHEGVLRIIRSSTELLSYLDTIVTEVRTGKLLGLLRADYALARSPIFGKGLFFQVPPGAANTPRHLGATLRRGDVDPSSTPRVVLNYNHELVSEMERFLEGASSDQQQLVQAWLDSFCDGVVEDNKTKLAPRARWERLHSDLSKRLGVDLPDLMFDSLRVSI